MKQGLTAFLVGFLFAIGLGISGMTQPVKVLGFLDITGAWDPSLLFVMIGAIGLHAVTYRWIRKRHSPVLLTDWHVPTRTKITPALIIGSMLFGVGWGLVGYCPGPALTSMAALHWQTWLFVISMIVGMVLFKLIDRTLNLQK